MQRAYCDSGGKAVPITPCPPSHPPQSLNLKPPPCGSLCWLWALVSSILLALAFGGDTAVLILEIVRQAYPRAGRWISSLFCRLRTADPGPGSSGHRCGSGHQISVMITGDMV